MSCPSAGLVVGPNFHTGADLLSRGILPLVDNMQNPDISGNSETSG
jgi:hypothetical protein